MGGKSQLTGVFAGLAMLAVLFYLTGPLGSLPVAALGAVLIASAIGLIDVTSLRDFFGLSRTEFALSILTTVGVVLVGALAGILVAVTLALLRLLAVTSVPHDAILGRARGIKGFHDLADYPEAETVPGLLLYRFDAALLFYNADYFKSRVLKAVEESTTPVRWFVLDASPANFIDITAVYKIDEISEALRSRGIVFAIARPKRLLRRKLELGGLLERIGQERMFVTLKSAVRAYETEVAKEIPPGVDRGPAAGDIPA
jgi:MFS superfamily sulfate permease-like transporter